MDQPTKIMLVLDQARDAAIRISECMATLTHINSQNFSGMPHGDPVEQAELWIKAFDEIEQSQKLMRDAIELIGGISYSLGSKYAEPLYLYYFEAVPTWREVARRLGLSTRTIYSRKTIALEWAESVGYDAACKGIDVLNLGEITSGCE